MSDRRFRRHLVSCPHCGREVLSHMEACPFCKGALEPSAAKPMAPDKLKKLKLWLNVIGFALAGLLLLWRLLSR